MDPSSGPLGSWNFLLSGPQPTSWVHPPEDGLSWPFGHAWALEVAKRWLFAGGVDRIYARRLERPCLSTQSPPQKKTKRGAERKGRPGEQLLARADSPHSASSSMDPRSLRLLNTNPPSQVYLSSGRCICQGRRMEHILFSSFLA